METGRYGIHGGQYIPETLMNEIHNVEKAYEFYKNDPEFNRELEKLLKEYAGRPSLLYYELPERVVMFTVNYYFAMELIMLFMQNGKLLKK